MSSKRPALSRKCALTKRELAIVDAFKDGKTMSALAHTYYFYNQLGVEAIIRKALTFQHTDFYGNVTYPAKAGKRK